MKTQRISDIHFLARSTKIKPDILINGGLNLLGRFALQTFNKSQNLFTMILHEICQPNLKLVVHSPHINTYAIAKALRRNLFTTAVTSILNHYAPQFSEADPVPAQIQYTRTIKRKPLLP